MFYRLTTILIKIIPYIFVLIGALIGMNVFVVLIGGTVLSLIIGVSSGAIPFLNMFNVVGDGIVGMYDITVISIIVACVVGLMKENGGIDYLLYQIKNPVILDEYIKVASFKLDVSQNNLKTQILNKQSDEFTAKVKKLIEEGEHQMQDFKYEISFSVILSLPKSIKGNKIYCNTCYEF